MLPCYCIAWLSHVLPWKLGATPFLRLGGLGHYIFSRSAISLSCIGGALLLAACGAQGLYTGTSQCGSHPGGLVVFPPVQAQRRRSLMDAVGQHAGAG